MALLGLVIGGFLALAAESRYSAWRRSSLIAQRQRRELTAVTDSVSKSVKSAAWRAAKTAAHDVSTAATERTKAEKKKADRAAADARDKAAAVAAQKATDEQVRLILGSRVFDIEWYHAQIAGELPTAERAVLHYLDRGRRAGFTPHPLFDPAEISRTWRKDATDPLVAYLRNERGLWSRATSPFFDPAAVDEDLPVSEYGPLSSFLLNRGQDYPLPAAGDVLPAGTKVPILRDLRRHLMAASADWRVREELVAPTGEPRQSTRRHGQPNRR